MPDCRPRGVLAPLALAIASVSFVVAGPGAASAQQAERTTTNGSSPSPAVATHVPARTSKARKPFTMDQSPIAGETVAVRGKVPSVGRSRPVLVQQKRGASWSKVARTRSKASGSFRSSFHAIRSGTVRIWAPAIAGRPAFASRSQKLNVVGQSGDLTLPGVVLRTQQATMTAVFSPARDGRAVTLQGRSGAEWTTVAQGVEDSAGKVVFTTLASTVGTFEYRATAAAAAGAPAYTTAVHQMRIDEFEVKISADVRVLTTAEQNAVSAVDLPAGTVDFHGPSAPHGLTGGNVISVAPTLGAPSGALLRVTAVQDLPEGVRVSTTDADLTDVVDRMPASDGSLAMCSVATSVTAPADGVTVDDVEADDPNCAGPPAAGSRRADVASQAGAVVIKAPKISMTANMHGSWTPVPGVETEWGVEGKISAGPVIEVGLDTTWYGQVTGYRAGGGIDWDASTKSYFKVTGRLESKSEKKFDVVKVVRTFGGFIGPVPVWADLEGKVVTKVGVEGSVELAYVNERTGRDLLGITNKSGSDLAPKAYSSSAATVGRFAEVKATGKALAGVGAEVQLSLYSIGGPYLNLGVKGELSISWSTQDGAECRIEAGPYLELGLQTSDLVKKITGGMQAGVSFEVFRRTLDLDLCPAGTGLDPVAGGAPEITTRSLPDANRGQPYSSRLVTADGRAGSWDLVSGGLPAGLALSSEGFISGTPTSAGRASFSVRFVDNGSRADTQDLTLAVVEDGSESDPCPEAGAIPVSECTALRALASANPGKLSGWTTGNPCQWWGVTCVSGRVTELDLYDRRLTTLPSSIDNLTMLRRLQLQSNDIASLPPEIGNLSNLVSLTLHGNRLTSVPSQIGKLDRLTNLTLSRNRLTSVPPEIGGLPALQSLRLGGYGLAGGTTWNQVTSLPPEIGNLTNLVELDLVNNALTSLPPEIGRLRNLKVLELCRYYNGSGVAGNDLTSLPPEIGDLAQLTDLAVCDNKLTSLPPEIGRLSKLTTLAVSSNQLTSLPNEIGNLVALTELHAYQNKLTSLPSDIGRLSKLVRLTVSSNQLTSLPPAIGSLTSLTELTVSDNALTSLPAEFYSLTKLRSFGAYNNQLTTISPQISNLTRLEGLVLEGNRLTDLPAELGSLALDTLYLSNNRLSGDISHWARPLSLRNTIRTLYLRGNGCLDAGGDAELAAWLTAKSRDDWRSGC